MPLSEPLSHRTIAALRSPRTVVVIYRERFELHLWRKSGRNYRRTKYSIAVGRIGDATPGGCYWVDAKTRRPAWLIPEHPDYEPEMWGVTIPFKDPPNPFAGGFLSISGGEGVGIHGTKFDPQLGTRASHGCIRMAVEDFLEIYRRVGLGSPALIV